MNNNFLKRTSIDQGNKKQSREYDKRGVKENNEWTYTQLKSTKTRLSFKKRNCREYKRESVGEST